MGHAYLDQVNELLHKTVLLEVAAWQIHISTPNRIMNRYGEWAYDMSRVHDAPEEKDVKNYVILAKADCTGRTYSHDPLLEGTAACLSLGS